MTTIAMPGKLCAACNYVKARRSSHYCLECSPIVRAVQRETKRLMGSHRMPFGVECEDCGRGAQARDHRYYAKPLALAYVCRTCNNLRGPALDIAAMVTEYKARQGKPYTPIAKRIKDKNLQNMTNSATVNTDGPQSNLNASGHRGETWSEPTT